MLVAIFTLWEAPRWSWEEAAGSRSSGTVGRRLRDSSAAPCGTVEKSMDYVGADLSRTYGVFSPVVCATKCWEEPACTSYTFAKWQGACYLKKGARAARKPKRGLVSGLRPCQAPPTPPPRKVNNYSGAPLRGIAYAPLPCTEGCFTSEDMLQEGYQPLWGAPPARDDLQVIKDLGANTVRLYHSIGLEGPGNHGLFLDRAGTLGLDVMPGYHTGYAGYPMAMPSAYGQAVPGQHPHGSHHGSHHGQSHTTTQGAKLRANSRGRKNPCC